MKRILTVVGNRPQFIKMAPLSKKFAEVDISESILHSGQHYDYQMNDIFFDELGIPAPKYSLKLTPGLGHGAMTAQILSQVEQVIVELKPDLVLVYGDTNTTLAACLAAVKLRTHVAHIEAGPRLYDQFNPEEINRKCVDHCSSILFCADKQSVANLQKEGLGEKAFFVGDLMYDAFENMRDRVSIQNEKVHELGYFVTIHRQENTDIKENLERVLDLLFKLKAKVVFSVHPRTEKKMKEFGLWDDVQANKFIEMRPPLGYAETVKEIMACKGVVTDSGGLQKEAFWAGKPSVFYFNQSPWPDLKNSGWQIVAGDFAYDNSEIANRITTMTVPIKKENFYGDGNVSEKIISILKEKKFI